MKITNVVYRGRLSHQVDLRHLMSLIPNSKLRVGKPTQLCCSIEDGSKTKVFIFCGGGLRIMGMSIDSLIKANDTMMTVLSHFTKEAPTLKLQTMTVTGKLENWKSDYFIRLRDNEKLSVSFDFELFSALRITHFNPVCVNIFSSGKIVLCGVKSITHADDIVSNINDTIQRL